MKKRNVITISTIAFIVIVFVAVTLIIASKNDPGKPKDIIKEKTVSNQYDYIDTAKLKEVTLDGNDKDGLIPTLNIWDNYETRDFAFSLKHGDKAWIVDRAGDGVKIMTKDKRVGWISYWFIKELK